MSYEDVDLALKQDLPAMQKIVLVVIASHRNGKTGACFPSAATIAKESGMSNRSAQYQIDALKKLGLIEIVNNFKSGLKASNGYLLNLKNTAVTDTQEMRNDTQEMRSGYARDAYKQGILGLSLA